MIKLYGMPVCHYYAMVKAFMLEKGFEFEEVPLEPQYAEPFLDLSPMGKTPFIELREGGLSETTAILGFLENCIPDVPMLEENNYDRAKMAQLIKVFELYLENQSQRLFDHVFKQGKFDSGVAAEVKQNLERGIAAINRLATFDPWIHGDEMTIADFFGYYTLAITRPVAQKVWDWDVLDDISGARLWLHMMSERPFINQVNQQRDAAISALENA